MLPSPLPTWLRQRIVEVIRAYRTTIRLCEQRCEDLAAAGQEADDCGSVDEYRMDGKYCAGTAIRLPLLLADCLTAQEIEAIKGILQDGIEIDPKHAMRWHQYNQEMYRLEMGPESWREVAMDPAKLAPWAFRRPLKAPEPTPEPEVAVPDWRVNEILQPCTQREAEALILTKVCLLEEGQVAEIMGCTPEAVTRYVKRARSRLKNSDILGKR